MSVVSGTGQVLTPSQASTMAVSIVATVARMVSNCLTAKWIYRMYVGACVRASVRAFLDK